MAALVVHTGAYLLGNDDFNLAEEPMSLLLSMTDFNIRRCAKRQWGVDAWRLASDEEVRMLRDCHNKGKYPKPYGGKHFLWSAYVNFDGNFSTRGGSVALMRLVYGHGEVPAELVQRIRWARSNGKVTFSNHCFTLYGRKYWLAPNEFHFPEPESRQDPIELERESRIRSIMYDVWMLQPTDDELSRILRAREYEQ